MMIDSSVLRRCANIQRERHHHGLSIRLYSASTEIVGFARAEHVVKIVWCGSTQCRLFLNFYRVCPV